MEKTNAAQVANYFESFRKGDILSNINNSKYSKLLSDCQEMEMAKKGDKYSLFIILLVIECIDKLEKNESLESVYGCITKTLLFARSRIVSIVAGHCSRGKEFEEYVESLKNDNTIEFPTSESTHRR